MAKGDLKSPQSCYKEDCTPEKVIQVEDPMAKYDVFSKYIFQPDTHIYMKYAHFCLSTLFE